MDLQLCLGLPHLIWSHLDTKYDLFQFQFESFVPRKKGFHWGSVFLTLVHKWRLCCTERFWLGVFLRDRLYVGGLNIFRDFINQQINKLWVAVNLLKKSFCFSDQVFVANPNKTQPILDILLKNQAKLIEFLSKFQNDRTEDEQFNDEKTYLIKQIRDLKRPAPQEAWIMHRSGRTHKGAGPGGVQTASGRRPDGAAGWTRRRLFVSTKNTEEQRKSSQIPSSSSAGRQVLCPSERSRPSSLCSRLFSSCQKKWE